MSNPRRFRLRDNNTLTDTYAKVMQIRHKLEEQMIDKECEPHNLPPCVIPSEIVYQLAISFEAAYDKMMEDELIKGGFPKSSNTKH